MKTVLLKPRFRWTRLHSLYNELIKNPPENYRITTINGVQKFYFRKLSGHKYYHYYYLTLLYYFAPIPFIFSKLSESSIKYDSDIIFASQHVIKTEQPWVVDLEFSDALAGYVDLFLCKNIISKRLKSQSCKAILPWSDWAADTLRKSFDCRDFNDKIRVVRFTVTPKKRSRPTKKKSLTRILFVGSSNPANMYNFVPKGLHETMDAFIDLQKNYDGLELIIRSAVPPVIKEKARKFSNIKILEKPLTATEFEELYRSSDIFPHAGYESLNLSILEAMSYGLPVIATSLYQIPELIKHMKNGILIDLPNLESFYTKNKTPNHFSKSYHYSMKKTRPYLTEKLKEFMKLLIEDSSLRQKIGNEAALTIEKGEFSLQRKNDLLKEIFDSATS